MSNTFALMIRSMLSILCACVLWSGTSNAQAPYKILQVSGVVMVSDSLYPAPYVSVIRARDSRGTYTDRDGYFTLPVMAGDTLRFVCTGLVPSYFIIPTSVKDEHVSMVQIMDMDTVVLPTVYILPYPAPHNLRKELLALDLPGDHYRIFTRETGSITEYDGMADFSSRSYKEAAATINARYSGGFQSGGNLLNPSAWNSFIRSIRSGEAPGRR